MCKLCCGLQDISGKLDSNVRCEQYHARHHKQLAGQLCNSLNMLQLKAAFTQTIARDVLLAMHCIRPRPHTPMQRHSTHMPHRNSTAVYRGMCAITSLAETTIHGSKLALTESVPTSAPRTASQAMQQEACCPGMFPGGHLAPVVVHRVSVCCRYRYCSHHNTRNILQLRTVTTQ